MDEVGVTRKTASKYLLALVDDGFLREHQAGRSKFFINDPLFALLLGVEA